MMETERLLLRPMTWEDRPAICAILQDEQTMYAYEHPFSEEEVDDWMARQMKRYETDGFGLWAAVERNSGSLVGQIGLTLQEWEGKQVPEIGYLLNRRFWGMGYATEGAKACKAYAFETLGLDAVYSIIRDNNLPSQGVARRNGMHPVGRQIKHYYHMDMPHTVWVALKRGE